MEEAFGIVLSTHEIAQRGELFLLPMEIFVIDVQDQATCYFFEVFDWVGASTLVEGSFDHNTVAETAPLGERALLAGISAVGKASLANIQHSTSLRESASADYVTSLKFVNMALGDPDQLTEDSTLTSIFLLSIFELIVSQDRCSIENWLNHVGGAARLLETRGRESLSKTSSPSLFYSWRSQIILYSLARKVPVPSKVLELSSQFATTARDPVNTSTWELTKIISTVAQIRHGIDIGQLRYCSKIMDRLESINSELNNWAARVSPSSGYDEVPAMDSFQINDRIRLDPYKEYVHRYTGFWAADMWNQYRTTKLLLQDMMLAHLYPEATSPGPNATSSQRKCIRIRTEMRIIADDICHSAPYILGLLNQEKREGSAVPVRPSTGAFLLLWPLTVAALVNPNASKVNEFCFRYLDFISEVMGIRQAAVFRRWVPSLSTLYTWADQFTGTIHLQ
ncbi:hypothetical protein N7540_001073 [Penicillium herquei]|nr:hypothetical protein N7540_001073 [Penicillium herquei]